MFTFLFFTIFALVSTVASRYPAFCRAVCRSVRVEWVSVVSSIAGFSPMFFSVLLIHFVESFPASEYVARGMRNDENHLVFPFCLIYGSYADKSSDLSSDSSFTLFSRYSFSGRNLVTEHPARHPDKPKIADMMKNCFDDLFATFIVFILQK